jgi:hypothetical protein
MSLASDIAKNFGSLGFRNYLGAPDDPEVWTAPRLIVQLDSLMNVMLRSDDYLLTGAFDAKYDLIVLDESESLLAHLDEGTMEGKAIETFDFLDELLRLSSRAICLDGDMSDRTLSFLGSFPGAAVRYVRNVAKAEGKSIRVMREQEEFRLKIAEDVVKFLAEDPSFRICIACQGAGQVEDLRGWLAESFPELRIVKLTGQDSSETKRRIFENINETLGEANVFIYSPVVESGVDITVPVRKIYGTLCAKSNSQRAYLQMLARCRNVADGEVVLLNDPAFLVNANYSFWRFPEVEALNREPLGLAARDRRLRTDGNVMTFAEDVGAKRKTVSIYNATEKLNKHPTIFLDYLRVLAQEKGYGWTVDELQPGQRPTREPAAFTKVNCIVGAGELTVDDYERLSELRKRGKTTSEENYALEKFFWKRFLVVEELDPKALKPYLYDDVFKSFLGLVDVRNHREEDTMQSVKFRERCHLARELIRGLGFASAVDDGVVSSDDLVANFVRGVVAGSAFANRKRTNELFGFGKKRRIHEDMDVKAVITWANVVLRQFSLRLKRRGDRVRLLRENGILELIQRRNERGARYEDAEGLLHQPAREPWQPRPGLGQVLDAFLDE